jgi:molybdenum cofactor cytidylyltransferase
MELFTALRLNHTRPVALVGAGGKTSAMVCLARELLGTCSRVVLTTTTHLGMWQVKWGDTHLCLAVEEGLLNLGELPRGVVFITGQPVDDQRVKGLTENQLEELASISQAGGVPLLIEADGARMLPLKAPGNHEPSIPGFVGDVIVCAGLSALGKPLTSAWVHRSEIFAQLSGIKASEVITTEAVSRVLAHPQGGLKNIPATCRRSLLLTQVDTALQQAQARSIAEQTQQAYHRVVIADLPVISAHSTAPVVKIFAVHEMIAGIILAAGSSQRFGSPKQLAEFNGLPLVDYAVRAALAAGLNPVLVITGAAAEQVREVLKGYSVRLVHNPDWQTGQSTSIRAGVKALPLECGGAVFMLADQPLVPTALIQALAEEHARTLAPIIAPLIDGRRGNPVLFDRTTFSRLLTLSGDQGGRQLFSSYPVTFVPWHDSMVLYDIDTPEDLLNLNQVKNRGGNV